ncbi:MAG: sigma-70 family RNA polymerase sigma factor [Planctomycetota bacterium]
MTEPRDTLALLRAWNAGSEAALGALLERHLHWIAAYVHRRLGKHLRAKAETQDFVQLAMIDFLRHGPRVEVADEDAFRGLLARIVENNIRDQLRYHHRQRRSPGREWGAVSDTCLCLHQREVTRPSERVHRDEQAAYVRLALELLGPEDREVIWLREFQELPFADVAAQMGVKEDAARMRFARALPRLAAKVAQLRAQQLQTALEPDAPGA